MAITAAQVKELREKTGVGMMECKKALGENDGDLEKAILWLRERGLSRAAKKADRVAAEGLVEVYVNEDQNAGVALEVNCETDFVSKNEDFRSFAHEAAALALKNNINDVEKLKELKMKNGETVQNTLSGLIAKIGENMNLRRVKVLTTNTGTVSGYSHMGGKIGCLVLLDGAKGPATEEVGKDLAMHVAAAAPRFLTSADVDAAELEQEKDLARKKIEEQNKPKDMVEKILAGQISKFYKEVCLVEQPFVKDPNVSVQKLVADKAKGAKLTGFVRFHLGEGMEKRQENFADEVAAVLK